MVVRVHFESSYPEWSELLGACEDYAVLSGWRFSLSDFMNLSERHSPEMGAAKERALPTALEFGDRVRACASARDGGAQPRLLAEFEACQRRVSAEAVYNSMLATIEAVGLGATDESGAAAATDEADGDALAYQDMSQPIEVIARRLRAYHAMMESSGGLEERNRRLLHATFIVEFGLEHGLPERPDATSEATLTEFMTRLGEWEGARHDTAAGEMVRALVLDKIPDGPAKAPLRKTVREPHLNLRPSRARSRDPSDRFRLRVAEGRTFDSPPDRWRSGPPNIRGRPSSLEPCSARSLAQLSPVQPSRLRARAAPAAEVERWTRTYRCKVITEPNRHRCHDRCTRHKANVRAATPGVWSCGGVTGRVSRAKQSRQRHVGAVGRATLQLQMPVGPLLVGVALSSRVIVCAATVCELLANGLTPGPRPVASQGLRREHEMTVDT